jgi:molecular chaperone GrpE
MQPRQPTDIPDKVMSDTPENENVDLEAMNLEKMADELLAEDQLDPLEQEVVSLREEVAASKDRLLRFAAEAENTKKRLEREKAEATLYAASNFAKDLLGVADTLSRTLAAVPPEERDIIDDIMKKFLIGIEMTERELLNVFQRHNLRKMETIGQKFDPNFHQALFEVPTSEKPPGTVMQEIQSGYVVGERCLRPALVGVAKAE